MSTPKTPLKHFNETVKQFLSDLKGVFESNDREMITIETAFELTSVNARLFIKPFQAHLLSNPEFVEKIMQDDVDFFINYDFTNEIDQDDETCVRMFRKFKQATIENRDNSTLLKAIFNWFKVMIYYAKLDQGIDMRTAPASKPTASASTTTVHADADAC